MIRHPPEYVPSESTSALRRYTQVGVAECGPIWPPSTRASATIPIVLDASCRPWPTDIVNAENDCAMRKPRFNLAGCPLRKTQRIVSITT